MISREEIENRSREFEIHISNVERDYVFGWLLFGFFSMSGLKDKIFLKGGNALRKGYFQNTRFSKDLDFGIPNDIARSVLLDEMNKVCDFIQEKAGIQFLKDENRVEEKFTASEAPLPRLKVYDSRIYFRDFYGNSDHIKLRISMDITRYDKVLLPIQTVKLIHPYTDASEIECTIRCMKLEEIIATKLKCLMQREHAPDLFDYAYSIHMLGGQLNKAEVVTTLLKKTIFQRNPSVLKKILQSRSFDFVSESWNEAIICSKNVFISVKQAIELFLTDLDSLFVGYPDTGYRQFVYFNPEFRIPIMKAGRTQTLLKMRYNGVDRIVEPYSLKYLQRKDGVEREYLYAFNCTGGKNPPGIRSFVADKVESVENTEDNFDPRFLIELGKAGERPEKPYLFDPNKPSLAPRKRPGRITMRSSFQVKYIYQCPNCGRKFTKKKNDSRLGSHKDKRGYPCGGRYGYYVDTKYP